MFVKIDFNEGLVKDLKEIFPEGSMARGLSYEDPQGIFP